MSVSGVLRRAVSKVDAQQTTLRELIQLMGEHGLLFLCILLCVPFLFPVSVPGVSTVFGAGIILIGIAITLNRMPWLPSRLVDRKVETSSLKATLEKGVRLMEKVETFIKPRLFVLTSGAVVNRVNGLAIVFAAGLLMLPLGLVPFSNTLPAVAIMLLALGMSQRDGWVVVAGYFMIVVTLVYFGALAFLGWQAGTAFI